MLIMFLLSITSTANAREWVSGGAAGVKCLAPGNREVVTYDYGNKSSKVRTVTARVGSDWGTSPRGNRYRCMGRCGANCWGAPATSRMYTQDCLAHDVCSRERNANGGAGDPNCGDEFNAAVGDTVLALSNLTCRYKRGNHVRAARGEFPK